MAICAHTVMAAARKASRNKLAMSSSSLRRHDEARQELYRASE